MIFYTFITIVIAQRLFELIVAKRNEKWMKERGAIEFGQRHYFFIVLLHITFFISLILEVELFQKELSTIWPILFPLFLIAQWGRIWALSSLGRYWNTRIIVLPNAKPVTKGPYQYVKHPNYIIVTAELLIMPLLFNAYWTMLIFTLLNGIMLSVRIPSEEKALKEISLYEELDQPRFIPSLVKKND